jgi:hypothetical protein
LKDWERNLFRPLAIAAMTGCVALSLTELVGLVTPDWSGTYLVVGCVVAALEACYSYRLVERRQLRGPEALRFRAIEIALILILVKAGSYAGSTWTGVLADLQTWPSEPRAIVDTGDILGSMIVLGAWLSATATTRDLERIGEPLELRRNVRQYVRSVTGRFFWGGALLMVAAGLTRIGISALLDLERPPVPRLVANVLAYFLIGLVMLGQIHLTRMRRQWESQEVEGAGRVSGQWARYSLLLIGIAAVLAVIIPIGYAGGVLETGAAVVNAVLYVLSLAAWLLSTLITLILWLISGLFESLLGRGLPGRPRLQPVPRRSVVPRVGIPFVIPGWLETARTALFWAATLAMVFYVVRSYLRDHPEMLETLRQIRLVAMLRALLALLRRRWSAAAQAVKNLSARRAAERRDGAGAFRVRRLRPQSPRERVLYYYLSTLRRASRLGIPRRHHLTPREYAAVLGPRIPDSRVSLASLTEAFVEARYSLHEVDRAAERSAREYWRDVKLALRALRRELDSAADELPTPATHTGDGEAVGPA